ncbi:MAG: 50S ribosomal protein L13 [Spirochaetales bacterium]|nr:50S ribosomal protein L13 [Spirochaetales bacterium]
MNTLFIKPKDVESNWYLIDAEGERLGRIAVKAASIIRGKHKPEFAYHQDMGDHVIIINADKADLTGNKRSQKMYYRHSGYPGGLSGESYEAMLKRKPTYPMERAVYGMLPKGRLGRQLYKHLNVYAGDQHPHAAQKPIKVEI